MLFAQNGTAFMLACRLCSLTQYQCSFETSKLKHNEARRIRAMILFDSSHLMYSINKKRSQEQQAIVGDFSTLSTEWQVELINDYKKSYKAMKSHK